MDWKQIGQDIVSTDLGQKPGFSLGMSASGDRIVTGVGILGGGARILELKGCVWTQVGDDIQGSEGDGLAIGGSMTATMSADGNRVALGAFSANDDAGKAEVYDWDGENWTQVGQPILGESDSRTGISVSLSDDGLTLAVGSPSKNASGDPGYVTVYVLVGNTWIQYGQRLVGVPTDQYGLSVSLSSDGSKLAVSAPRARPNGPRTGSTIVYEIQDGTWVPIGSEIVGLSGGDQSGELTSLSGDGTRIVIGAQGNDLAGTNSGIVRIFHFELNDWVEKLGITGEDPFDALSRVAISKDGNRVIMGAFQRMLGVGYIRTYEWNEDEEEWIELGSRINGTTAGSNTFGRHVTISADGTKIAAADTATRYVRAYELLNSDALSCNETAQSLTYWTDVLNGQC